DIETSFIQKHKLDLVPLVLWLLMLAGLWLYARLNNLTMVDILEQLDSLLTSIPLGPLIFMTLFLVRSVLFLPIFLMLVAVGYYYGPFWGIIIGIAGTTLSAMVAYFISSFYGTSFLPVIKERPKIYQYADSVKQNTFKTISVMRLFFVQFDLVSYLAGLLQVSGPAYGLSTFLGTLPFTIGLVLIGVSIQWYRASEWSEVSLWPLGLGLLIFLSSPVIGWFVYRRKQ
ncbi:MAG TPA: VTT domain-containing protein, partial [Anaerolineae bacterium]|nr:VTT domain-containing protein [Anaerolineae bacterium]